MAKRRWFIGLRIRIFPQSRYEIHFAGKSRYVVALEYTNVPTSETLKLQVVDIRWCCSNRVSNTKRRVVKPNYYSSVQIVNVKSIAEEVLQSLVLHARQNAVGR